MLVPHNPHKSLSHDQKNNIQSQQDEQSEVDRSGERGKALQEGVVEDQVAGEPEEEDEEEGEQEQAAHKPARAAPVLVAGPEFGGDGQDKIGGEDERPPGP